MNDNDMQLFSETEADLDQLLDYAAKAGEQDIDRWENSLSAFIDIWAACLQRTEAMAPEDAGRIARALAAETAHYQGGRTFYFPKDDRLRRALRDNQIWEDHIHGRKTHEQLAAEHKMTVTSVYMILARQTQMRRKKLQPELPGIEPAEK